MRRVPIVGSLGLCSCFGAGFEAVDVLPSFGWEDGCTLVRVSGHGFGDDVAVTVGGAPLESPTLPTDPDDAGFGVAGRTPAGAPGYASVAVTTNGETSEIVDGFYYRACPGPTWVEVMTPGAVAPGDVVTIQGCGLDAATLSVRIAVRAGPEVASVPLEPLCGTGTVRFVAPELDPWTYWITLVDAGGEQVWPELCDTADTGVSCNVGYHLEWVEAP